MNLHKVGMIDVRAQVCRYALVGAMLLAALGCSRNRQSYRPVYTSPARTSAPCVGCDSAAGAVDSGSTTSSVIPQAPDAGTIESLHLANQLVAQTGANKLQDAYAHEPRTSNRTKVLRCESS